MQARVFITFILSNLLLACFPISKVSAQTPASSSSGLEEITENVKKRIQGVIEEQTSQKSQTVNFGKLASMTTNTLSLNSEQGIILASTSAQTRYLRLPGNTNISYDDLVIDEYLIVVGPQNPTQVVDAAKVISQKTPPTPPIQQSYFGKIYTYDPKDFILTIDNPTETEQREFVVGRKSMVYLANPDGTKARIDRRQDLPIHSQVLVIFEPPSSSSEDTVVQEMLLVPSSPIITPPELKP